MHHTWSVMTGLFLVAVTGTKMVSPAWGGARPMTAPTAPLSQPCEVEAQLHVVRLPNTPVVDMTKPLPSIPGALVEVAELGVKARTDTEGNARFHLELNPGSCERVYTFVVTIPASAHQSVTRLLIPKAAPNWRLFFDPTRDLYADDSFKKPPKAPVTVVVLDRRGVFPIEAATITVEELGLTMETDEHGEADLLVPLGGPWTFDVTVPGSPLHTKVRKGVFHQGGTRLLIRHGGR